MKRSGNHSGFTLLELLAAITLLVLLFSMVFQIFGGASDIMRISVGRQEVFEYARTLFEIFSREMTGVIGVRDAGPDKTGSPFRIGTSQGAVTDFEQALGVDVREGSDIISFRAALVGRDMMENSPTPGQVANVASVAYWLTPDNNILNRYEFYNVARPTTERGWEFALNVLEFEIEVLDQWSGGVAFERKDWDSRDTASSGARRGVPGAMRLTIKLTDIAHVNLHKFDADRKCMVPVRGVHASSLDPIVKEFSHVVCFAKKQ